MAASTRAVEEPAGSYPDKKRIRIAVASFYFSMGLCFASWASRIPDIKTALHLSDAAFGTTLFALPVGQFLMMPFSGRLVTRFGSSKVVLFAFPAYTLCLTNLGLAHRGWQLGIGLFLFGICGNMCNISINTQGVAAERLYGRPIMSAFHGGWSIAGFSGALVGLAMINLKVPPYLHFWMVGMGVSRIVPSVYSAAGKQGRVAPGIALATVASVGFLGFLTGPPLIGYISAAAGLRYSFAVIGICGIGNTLLVSKIKTAL